MRLFAGIALLLITTCSPSGPDGGPEPVEFRIIEMVCMDRVSIGGELQVVVRTEEEYEDLIVEWFQRPLDEYWAENYPRVRARVEQRYPGQSDEWYEAKVREIFYSVLPFRGTANCSHPDIDFSEHSLLGLAVHGGGCRTPDYKVEYLVDRGRNRNTLRVGIRQYGSCEMAISANKWLLVPRLPSEVEVQFERYWSTEAVN